MAALSYLDRFFTPHRSTSSCCCSPTSVTTVCNGLIEVEGEFNGSDVGVCVHCQRKKVGGRAESVDESQWQFAGDGGGVRLL